MLGIIISELRRRKIPRGLARPALFVKLAVFRFCKNNDTGSYIKYVLDEDGRELFKLTKS